LESVCWGNSTVGSNPTLSAIAFRSFISNDLQFWCLSRWPARESKSKREELRRYAHPCERTWRRSRLPLERAFGCAMNWLQQRKQRCTVLRASVFLQRPSQWQVLRPPLRGKPAGIRRQKSKRIVRITLVFRQVKRNPPDRPPQWIQFPKVFLHAVARRSHFLSHQTV
jgi:hypothetical protein